MTTLRLLLRNLRHHRRPHAALALGVAVASSIVVGSLAMGDTLRHSLEQLAALRLGATDLSLETGERSVREALADELAQELDAVVAPALSLRGLVSSPDGAAKVGAVQVLGVDDRFWSLGHASAPSGVALNEALLDALAVPEGAPLVVRVDRPAPVAADTGLTPEAGRVEALRVRDWSVVGDDAFGRFSLRAEQASPLTLFVPLRRLQEETGSAGRTNLLLFGRPGGPPLGTDAAEAALRRTWRLADVEHEVRPLGQVEVRLGRAAEGSLSLHQSLLELRSDRVFLAPELAAAAEALPGAAGVLTYLVDELRHGDASTPYSMVSAVRWRNLPEPLPATLGDGEIVINEWLADDLSAGPGDTVELGFRVVDHGRRFLSRRRSFTVAAVVPLEGAAADRSWSPSFPGIEDEEHCRDWSTGFPLDFSRIRDRDEAYWAEHRGTPKAFVTLAAGESMWAGRFGTRTAVRLPAGDAAGVSKAVHAQADPRDLGLALRPVRAWSHAASQASYDFGELFVGYSFFAFFAAILLSVLLFSLSLDARTPELGLALGLGFSPRRARWLLWVEGAVVVTAGAIAGAAGGVAWAHLLLAGVGSLWSPVSAGSGLTLHVSAASVAIGCTVGAVATLAWTAVALRYRGRAAVRELLSATTAPAAAARRRGRAGPALAMAALAGAAILAASADPSSGHGAAGAYMGTGALLLAAGILGVRELLGRQGSGSARGLSRLSLGINNAARRPARSLSTVALLGCATFLVLSVSAGRRDPNAGAGLRASGTGGFALFAETTLPILQDLSTPEGRARAGVEIEPSEGTSFVSLRVHDGDEASCRNLNLATAPRILGVDPDALERRGAFRFLGIPSGAPAWSLLKERDTDTIPAIGDQATVYWALHRDVGDTVPFVDAAGRELELEIVAMMAGSVLQGSLVIAEDAFVERFPTDSGYRVLLVDAPAARAGDVAAALTRDLAHLGPSVEPAAARLGRFSEVENTYVAIFLAVGGLGLLLGCVGVGLVVLRNLLERRRELAIMLALGFGPRELRRSVFGEHALLVGAGVLCGALPAAVAAIPILWTDAAAVPWHQLILLTVALIVSGLAWAWLAAAAALRHPPLEALRRE